MNVRGFHALILSMLIAFAPLGASAASQMATNAGLDEPTIGTMLMDGLVLRPLGLVGTVVGTAGWIVTLPFSLLGGNAGDAADTMIIKPAEYTFVRPLGEI
jgi:hypothetical protein